MRKVNYSAVELVTATIADYPIIQNLARFYAYDIAREAAAFYDDWDFPENGLYECKDFLDYFKQDNNKNFIIKINKKLAGFILIDKLPLTPEVDFNMGQFYIVAQYQNQGLGQQIAFELFNRYKGKWSIGVIPENTKALNFWRAAIDLYTNSNFVTAQKSSQELMTPEHPNPYPMEIFIFDTSKSTYKSGEQLPNTTYTLYKNPKNAYDAVDSRLFAFNKSCVPATQDPYVIKLNYIIKQDDEFVAGICADVYTWKILYISLLFVDEQHRGKKLASILLEKLENEAIALGVRLVHLDTFDFQAKDFYLKHGYKIFGVLEDCPEGHERYYLSKKL